MKIYFDGCSWTWGAELKDPYQSRYSKIISDKLGAEEYNISKDYDKSVYNSHDSIGRAIFFTGITIIFGFSILILSNFIPTIIFGLLTGLAMFIALVAVLTLLPKLLINFRPL